MIRQYFEYNTIPSRILEVYGDYLPENYLCPILTPHSPLAMYGMNDSVGSARTGSTMPAADQMEKKSKRGRPRKEVATQRRTRQLRNCIDPNPPAVDKGILTPRE